MLCVHLLIYQFPSPLVLSLSRVLGQHVQKKTGIRFGMPGERGANVLVPAGAELLIHSGAASALSKPL